MKIVAALSVLCVVVLSGCDAESSYKTVSALTPVEKGGLDQLMLLAYKNATKGSLPCFTYVTEYRYVPTVNGGVGASLSEPLKLISYACIGPTMLMPETKVKIKDEIDNLSMSWSDDSGRHNISIVEWYLVPKPGGAGGAMGLSNDMATIYPTKILVKKIE